MSDNYNHIIDKRFYIYERLNIWYMRMGSISDVETYHQELSEVNLSFEDDKLWRK